MSSILKALKKLETAPDGKSDIRPLSQTVDPGRYSRQARQAKRVRTAIYLPLFLVLIGGGIFWGYHSVHTVSSENPPSSVESPAPAAAPPAVVSAAPQIPGPAKDVGAAQALDLPVQATSAAEENPHEIIEEPEGSGGAADSLPRAVVAAGSSVSPALGGMAVLPDEKDRLLPRLDYTALQLQAITWAVRPRDRFALVDNTILRTGDSINDYTIENIQEEYIVVRQGGRRWRVEFRLR